jgi:GMP synthase (glutamine-hydrolysing)
LSTVPSRKHAAHAVTGSGVRHCADQRSRIGGAGAGVAPCLLHDGTSPSPSNIAIEEFMRAPTAIVIRHVAFEDLGLLQPLLEARGFELRWLDAGVDDLAEIDPTRAALAVVLGGPISVYEGERYPWLAIQIDWMRRRLVAGRPTLGICLGAQMMAAALGARVYPGRVKEIGWSPLTLTAAAHASALAALDGTSTSMLHWHGDTFELPAGATLLAGTAAYPHQAFAWGDSALALQCPSRFERWLIGHAVELAHAGIDLAALRAQTERHGPALARQARLAFDAWLRERDAQLADRVP